MEGERGMAPVLGGGEEAELDSNCEIAPTLDPCTWQVDQKGTA